MPSVPNIARAGAFAAVVFLVLALSGCAGGTGSARWKQLTVAAAYAPPKELTILLENETKTADATKAINQLEYTLQHELWQRGIDVRFVYSDDEEWQARITMTEWDRGDPLARQVVGFGAGAAWVTVHVVSPDATGGSGVEGIAEGWLIAESYGSDATAATNKVGQVIADTIATGRVDDDPHKHHLKAHGMH